MSEVMQVRKGTPANDFAYETYFQDDFSGDLSKWYRDTLEDDGLHRVGNSFLNDDGSIADEKWKQPKGARWAGLYNDHRNLTEFIENGQLIQKIHPVREANPYRENYRIIRFRPDSGKKTMVIPVTETLQDEDICSVKNYCYGDWKFFVSWLSTGTRIKDKRRERFITDFDKPLHLHGPGSYINMRVCYEHMLVRNCRHSLWSMPMHMADEENTPENPARLVCGDDFPYNDVTEDGVEIDVIEYVVNRENGFEIVSQKNVCGAAGDTPDGSVNHENDMWDSFKIDMLKGFHDIGCLWHPDGHHDWFIDGYHTNHDPRPVLTMNYLALTEEINSGCKKPKAGKDRRYPAGGPRRPHDAGLTGDSCIEDLEHMMKHKVIIDDISVMKATPRKTQVQGSDIERAVASVDTTPPFNPKLILSPEPDERELEIGTGFPCPKCGEFITVT